MEIRAVEPSLSPSMDIQVSSNFERLLFDVFGRDGSRVAAAMRHFRAEGRLTLEASDWEALRRLFSGYRVDDPATERAIAEVYRASGELLDPHTAIGVAAGRARRKDPAIPVIALATAHPAKFPDAVERATGVRPKLPARLHDLFEREEKYSLIDNDVALVEAFVRERAAMRGAA